MKLHPLLLLAVASLFATVASAQTSLISEDFSTATGSTPPSGWTNNIITGTPGTDDWRFDNPGFRTINAPMSAPVAVFDSDNYSNNATAEDVALESPAFDASSYSAVTLSWDQFFQSGFNGAVFVEVYNGATWTAVYNNSTTTTANPENQSLDITTEAGGSATAQVRFRWTGDYSWYWIIDNVNVDGSNIGFSVTTGATSIPNGGSIQALDGSALSALALSFDATGTNSPGTITSVVTNSSLITNFAQSEWDASGSFSLQATPATGSFNGLGTINVAITVTDNAAGTLNYSFDIVVTNTLSLTTTFAGGNGCGGGNMFDLTATNAIEITAFDVNTSDTTATTVEIYYIANGTYVGNQTVAGSWTLHESVSTTGAGSGNATSVPLTTPLAVPAGSTYAIYVYFNADYTNATGTVNDANISISYGDGLCGQFATVNTGRQFNGTVYYTLPAPSAPTITSTAPATAYSGTAYSYTVTATGAATITYSISPDPMTLGSGWLTWDGTDTLSGTPAAGDIGVDIGPFTITATNGISPDATELITVSVVAGGPEIEVLDPNLDPVNSGDTLTYFGSVMTVPATGTFTINNLGNQNLTISSATTGSDNNGGSSVTSAPASPVAASSSTTIGLSFTPAAAGTWSFVVTIVNNDTDETTFTFTITGDAQATPAPEITLGDPNDAEILNGGTYSESNTGVANFSRDFNVVNIGAATLTLTPTGAPVVIGAENNCTVTVTTQPSDTVAAATGGAPSTSTFTLSITPLAAGAFSFTVTIANDDTTGSENPYVFTFSGNTAAASSGGGGGSDSSCSTGSTGGYSWMALLGLLSALVVFTRIRSSKA